MDTSLIAARNVEAGSLVIQIRKYRRGGLTESSKVVCPWTV
jgi:hypothetical protein